MPYEQPNRIPRARREARLTSLVGRRQAEPARRRPSDRHYLAVVAAEARRLARQLRPPTRGGDAGAEAFS